ncbi:hypothetical protein Ciccas_014548, partial [Cichlidogyrus casuarinus]
MSNSNIGGDRAAGDDSLKSTAKKNRLGLRINPNPSVIETPEVDSGAADNSDPSPSISLTNSSVQSKVGQRRAHVVPPLMGIDRTELKSSPPSSAQSSGHEQTTNGTSVTFREHSNNSIKGARNSNRFSTGPVDIICV